MSRTTYRFLVPLLCIGSRVIDGKLVTKCTLSGIWLSISSINNDILDWNISLDKLLNDILDWNISLDKLLDRKVGTGDNTFYWKDKWHNNVAIKETSLELYKIKSQKIV